jgi:hypothetical protein
MWDHEGWISQKMIFSQLRENIIATSLRQALGSVYQYLKEEIRS